MTDAITTELAMKAAQVLLAQQRVAAEDLRRIARDYAAQAAVLDRTRLRLQHVQRSVGWRSPASMAFGLEVARLGECLHERACAAEAAAAALRRLAAAVA